MNLPMGRSLTRDYRELTDAKIARWFTRSGRFCVGGNLYLNVTTALSRSWFVRYLGVDGKRHDIGLGPCELISLDEARAAALECRKLRAKGGDPLEYRREAQARARIELAKRVLFADCFEAYFAAFSPGWEASYAKRWRANLATCALPVLGKLPASSIDTQLILTVIGGMWNEKTTLARKLRGWLEQILDFATTRGMRDDTPNPARWKGHLDTQLAKPSKVAPVEHHAALHWRQIPEFFAAVRSENSVLARAMELIALTALRKSEAIGASWGEFDMAERIWTVPGERMKSRRPHRVPLSAVAVELLDGMRSDLSAEPLPQVPLFTTRRDKLLNPNFPDKLLRRLGYLHQMTTHGLRSSHTDFAAENLNLPREVRELALAHQVGDETERAYFRTDMFNRRRALAEAWGNWCAGRPIDPLVLIDGKQPAAAVAPNGRGTALAAIAGPRKVIARCGF
jgi:integrase